MAKVEVPRRVVVGGVCWCERFKEEAIVRCLDELFFPAWDALGL